MDEVVGVLVPKMAPLNGGYTIDIHRIPYTASDFGILNIFELGKIERTKIGYAPQLEQERVFFFWGF